MTNFPEDFPLDAIHVGDCVELLRKLPDAVRKEMTFTFAAHLDEVLEAVFRA